LLTAQNSIVERNDWFSRASDTPTQLLA